MAVEMKLKGTTQSQFRIKPASTTGAPTTGDHEKGEEHVDSEGSRFVCIADGTPGTWIQLASGTGGGGIPGSTLQLIFPITFNKTTNATNDARLGGLSGWEMTRNEDDNGAEFLFVLTDQVNLSTPLKLRCDLYTLTTDTGAGRDVVMRCTARYVAAGGGLFDVADEIIDETVVMVNTVGARTTLVFTLNTTLDKILATDAIFITVERVGTDVADTFGENGSRGTILFASSGGLEFGT